MSSPSSGSKTWRRTSVTSSTVSTGPVYPAKADGGRHRSGVTSRYSGSRRERLSEQTTHERRRRCDSSDLSRRRKSGDFLRTLGAAEQTNLFAPLAGEEVDAVDETHPVAACAHDERVSTRAVGEKTDAAQEGAAGDAGRGEDDLARHQVGGAENALDVVDTSRLGLLDLAPGYGPELSLELAAQAAKSRRGQHGLASSADADRQVIVGASDRGRDRS